MSAQNIFRTATVSLLIVLTVNAFSLGPSFINRFHSSNTPLYEKPVDIMSDQLNLDDQLTVTLTAKGYEVFDTISDEKLAMDALYEWEKKLDSLSSEIRQLNNKEILLKVYNSMLVKVTPLKLDPLQITSFELLSNAIADTLIRNYPQNTPVTELIDDITEIHLDFIEKFRVMIDDGGDDGYSQSAKQEYLVYQFAGLIQNVYSRLSMGLGAEFDKTQRTQDMRLSTWVSPVFARLQRRFVRFLGSDVDEKMEDMHREVFDKLIKKIKVEINPRYLLSGPLDIVGYTVETENETENEKSILKRRAYPPELLSSFIIKVMRNAVRSNELSNLEAKLVFLFQTELSSKMKPLMRKLENLYMKKKVFLDNEELKNVEEMLNLGHISVAAVLALWQVRHNIVGVQAKPVYNPDSDRRATVSDVPVKDFLQPVDVTAKKEIIESIPKSMRRDVEFKVKDFGKRLKPDDDLQGVSLLSNAVRDTASEDFRSLAIYNMDRDEKPINRDSVFIVVLSAVLVESFVSPVFNQQGLRENLVALAALEETLGVREPRAACAEGYRLALRATVLQLISNKSAIPTDLKDRVKEVERNLGMILRLENGQGNNCRTTAFRDTIDYIIAAAEEKGENAFKQVDSEYEWISNILSIDIQKARNYVIPLGQAKFDKKIGEMLMNADLTVLMPELGEVFEQQVYSMAEDVAMNKIAAEERVALLAGAVLTTCVEIVLMENNKQFNVNPTNEKVDLALKKAFYVYRHPLIRRLQERYDKEYEEEMKNLENEENKDKKIIKKEIRVIGMRMVISRLGAGLSMELVRSLERVKQRAVSAQTMTSQQLQQQFQAGWGGTGGLDEDVLADPNFAEFLGFAQSFLLQEFAAGKIKRNYSK